MEEKGLRTLLEQYFSNSISREDCVRLLKFLDNHPDDEQIHRLIDEILKQEANHVLFKAERKEHIYQNIQQARAEVYHLPLNERPLARKTNWGSVAAVILLILLSGLVGLWYLQRKEQSQHNQQTLLAVKQDILLPNAQQATLTLADGRTVSIDQSADVLLAQQDGVNVIKGVDGSVSYEMLAGARTDEAAIQYNTLSTPKGSSYQLILPDGTKVWLNTASSIRFPIAFQGKERRVVLQGEAYFEVTKDSEKPFFVEANQSLIKVLGTSFNISAYKKDHNVVTTLLEGGVNVASANGQVVLKPGQQATVNVQTQTIEKSVADIRSITAWKEGVFRFNNASVETIMQALSRWYDIEGVTYEGHSEDRFSGTFHRSKSINQLFQSLEKMSSIKFEIQERRVKIMR